MGQQGEDADKDAMRDRQCESIDGCPFRECRCIENIVFKPKKSIPMKMMTMRRSEQQREKIKKMETALKSIAECQCDLAHIEGDCPGCRTCIARSAIGVYDRTPEIMGYTIQELWEMVEEGNEVERNLERKLWYRAQEIKQLQKFKDMLDFMANNGYFIEVFTGSEGSASDRYTVSSPLFAKPLTEECATIYEAIEEAMKEDA